MKSQFLIAAPHSGSGKTTVARGLMALLTEKDYRVQPYKCGPDYIDAKFHTAVCQRPSINLDSFMADHPTRSVILDQVYAGVLVRMAALYLLLGGGEDSLS